MELDLYWYCPKCGVEVTVHALSAATMRRCTDERVTIKCECGEFSRVSLDDCTTERRVPVVSAPAHDSGAMWEVDGVPVPVVKVFPTETRGRYATATVYRCNSKECGALSLKDALFDGLCACGASVAEVHDVSKDQFRRLSAQGDEIVALVRENERLTKERDEARAEVERLSSELIRVTKQRDASGLAWDEAENAVQNLRSRIAALEAVIRAQSEHARAIARSNQTAFELAEAAHAAGIEVVPTLPATESPAAAPGGEKGTGGKGE